MKRISALIIVGVVLFTFMVNAFSVDIDGVSDGPEWHDATYYVLSDGDSNCNITFSSVKVKFDTENSALFLCLMFIDPLLETDNDKCGVKISVNNSLYFIADASSSTINDDLDKYSFDGAVTVDENNGAVCELRIGFKEGLTRIVDCDVQFIDSEGEASNHYLLSLVNEGYVKPTAVTISPSADNSDPYYNPEILKTTVKTTKEKTEKQTTKRNTTTSKIVTTEFVINEPPMIYTGRTKAPKTSEFVTAEKETIRCVTVCYFEREVIVSYVPVNVTEKSAATVAETLSEEPILSTDITNVKAESQSSDLISIGTQYKKILVAAGAVAFALIAIFGVAFTKKNNTDI